MCMHFILYVPLRYNIPSCIYATISIIENLQYNFPKMRDGGVKGCLEFSQKSHLFWLPDPSLIQVLKFIHNCLLRGKWKSIALFLFLFDVVHCCTWICYYWHSVYYWPPSRLVYNNAWQKELERVRHGLVVKALHPLQGWIGQLQGEISFSWRRHLLE